MLGEQARSIWAKTGGPDEWLPLVQHMLDTLSIARRLMDRWLSPQVAQQWAEHPWGLERISRWAVFLAGVHDVGKAAPVFVAQCEPLAQRARDAGLECATMEFLRDARKALPHSVVSQNALRLWLLSHEVPSATARSLASVLGAHHGRPVTVQEEKATRKYETHGMGGEPWARVRTELIEWVAGEAGILDLLPANVDEPLPLPILVEISGFVIVADWLASNTRLFPLRPRASSGDPDPDMEGRLAFAWDEIALSSPWSPDLGAMDVTDFFRARFGWSAPAEPRAVQRAVLDVARSEEVGLLIVETMTGDGKTEAALAAAEVIAARRGSQGLLIALPTQATTNAMFRRVTTWLDLLPQPPFTEPAWALTLGHGKSMLNQQYAEMAQAFVNFDRLSSSSYSMAEHGEEGDEPTCNAVVHTWFLSAKRRLLANFGIVTIDQLLMAGLQRRHLMLAHLGLAGKVVVIDEAHAADEYMNVYLDSVLSWLAAYRVPVIVLSATLTDERRRAMMRAYARDRAPEIDALEVSATDYPDSPCCRPMTLPRE